MENTLRVERARRCWSQKRLAVAAGIGFDRYFRIEKGYTEPTREEQDAIARALALEVAEVFPPVEQQVA